MLHLSRFVVCVCFYWFLRFGRIVVCLFDVVVFVWLLFVAVAVDVLVVLFGLLSTTSSASTSFHYFQCFEFDQRAEDRRPEGQAEARSPDRGRGLCVERWRVFGHVTLGDEPKTLGAWPLLEVKIEVSSRRSE